MAEAYQNEQGQVATVQAKQRYEQLQVEREPFLRRAREAAKLTLPYVMPPAGHSGATELVTPFQSVGAECSNSLAAKLLLALLPPGSSFFRLQLDAVEKDKLEAEAKGASKDILGEIEAALGKTERAVIQRLEQVGARISTFDALKHMIVCGNALVQIVEKGALRIHYLDRYVCKRDPVGNVLELIVLETIAKTALPPEARALCEEYESDDKEEKEREEVDVYTRVYRDGGQFKVYQEIHGKTVPNSEGSYPLEKSAWIPLRFTKVDGQDYGRGRVEEYIGDFWSLESLSQSMVEGTAIAAKVLFLMNESGTTSKQRVQDAPNGAIIDGDIKDIGVLRLDKYADFAVASKEKDDLKERLKQAFLVQQQRQAERVTAEEVRAVIAELEKALGGVYAILSQEFQLPLVKRVMHQMQREGSIIRLPDNVIAPQIITGLAALGRDAEFEKLRLLVADVGREFGPEAAAEYFKIGDYIARKAAALQIDVSGVLRTEDEVQQSRQQKLQAEMVSKLAPPLIKSGTDQQLAQTEPANATVQ